MPLERSQFTHDGLITHVRTHYGLSITSIRPLPLGSANCFRLSDETRSYFLKEFQSGITRNAIADEAALLETLIARDIPVVPIIPTLDGSYVTEQNGHAVCLQEFVTGTAYGYDDFPTHLLPTLAHTLGHLHTAMRDIDLPSHRYTNWALSYRAADSAAQYDQLLEAAEEIPGDPEYPRIVEELRYKRELSWRCEKYLQYYEDITYCPTHGDFQGCQTIWNGNSLRAIIDFSDAKTLPAVWEIMRSYVQSSAKCRATAAIDAAGLRDYVREYMRYAPLTARDLHSMPYVYLLQLAKSKFGYPQYLRDNSPDRVGLLHFAHWRTAMCREVESRAEELAEMLGELAKE
ncbi:MAG: phosphotransferase [Clostridia bacterium]|nr:phosphotransferase [Clostridia bacterium]